MSRARGKNWSIVDILGAKIDCIPRKEVVSYLGECMSAGKRCLVITANVDQVVNLQGNSALRKAYESADLIVPDGVPILWASRILGQQLPERVAGSDIIFDLCEQCGSRGLSVYLLGGRPGVAERASEIIQSRFHGARVAGFSCPPMGFEQSAEKCAQIVQEVARTRPDLLLVGLGSPKQEVFLSNNWHELNATVAVGVGIALEFLAGTQRRAPLWMQRAGLEWSWRLLKEPGRLWKRYLIQDPRFFWLLLRARWSRT